MKNNDKKEPKKTRWWLMEQANKSAVYGDPVQRCHLVPVGQINIVKTKSGKVSYSGLKTCRNSWGCPICSPRRMAEKSEVVKHMNRMIVNQPVMVTYTMQHKRDEALSDLMDQLIYAKRLARNGDRLARYNDACLGYICGGEITWNAVNGWHFHQHEINYLNRGKTIEDLEETVIADYKKAVEKSGKLVNEFTVHAKEWKGETDYLTKGSAITAELMGGMEKQYDESINIFGILSLARGRDNPNMYTRLYNEFLRATHRRKVTVISRSLNKWRLMAEERVKNMEEYKPEEKEIIATLTNKEWFDMCKKGIRYEVIAQLS